MREEAPTSRDEQKVAPFRPIHYAALPLLPPGVRDLLYAQSRDVRLAGETRDRRAIRVEVVVVVRQNALRCVVIRNEGRCHGRRRRVCASKCEGEGKEGKQQGQEVGGSTDIPKPASCLPPSFTALVLVSVTSQSSTRTCRRGGKGGRDERKKAMTWEAAHVSIPLCARNRQTGDGSSSARRVEHVARASDAGEGSEATSEASEEKSVAAAAGSCATTPGRYLSDSEQVRRSIRALNKREVSGRGETAPSRSPRPAVAPRHFMYVARAV